MTLRPRLALGRGSHEDEGPQPLRAIDGVGERRGAAHREPEEVEPGQAKTIDERRQVLDEVGEAQAARRVVGRARVAAGVGEVTGEGLGETRQLGPEVLAPRRRRAVQEDEGWSGAGNVVGDLEAVRVEIAGHGAQSTGVAAAGPEAGNRRTARARLIDGGPARRGQDARMPAMASTPARWDRASLAPVAGDGRRIPEIVQLGPTIPDLDTLFAFARDAELRIATLRLRVEEHATIAGGESLRIHEVLIRHPGRARVTVLRPDLPAPVNHDVWLSDGATVRAYRAGHRLATLRPARSALVGIDDRDLPGTSRPYLPLTALPPNSLADTFVHPGGYCQNVLATGAGVVAGRAIVAGREAIAVTVRHPRTIELAADRPDHRLEVAFDRETGLLVRLVESFGEIVTRRAEATELAPDAPIPDTAFSIAIPADAATIF